LSSSSNNDNDITKPKTALEMVVESAKPVFLTIFWLSLAINLLMLVTPLYALQVLDRVISSGSRETLLMLSLLMTGLYIALHAIQVARSFTLIKLGECLDKKLSLELFAKSVQTAAVTASVNASQNYRDLQQVKSFLSSAGINTLFDAPWAIIYMIVLFVIHPWMGWISVIGAATIFGFALINAYAINSQLMKSNDHFIKAQGMADVAGRNAEVVEAMGMMESVAKRWVASNQIAMKLQSVASYRNGIISNISKFIRMFLQMLVTGIGAYLVLSEQEVMGNGGGMTVGGMIASSIMVGRALAPFDQAIEVWKQMTTTLKSYGRLQQAYGRGPLRQEAMDLPTPEGRISVENLFFAPPSAQAIAAKTGEPPKHTLKGVSFNLEPGEVLAVIGPSAAGKSSLAKVMVGVWKASQGVVRLDGANVYNWNRKDFGKHVGYMPQDVELFNGSIKDNIARMSEDYAPESVVDAAKLSGAHDMILRLANGYESDIGVGGSSLSGGQRQRVGLARAFYGNPKLVLLDEPNASLDEMGERALIEAIKKAKERGITTIVISHRPTILSSVDKILILQEGAVAAFGTRDDIMARFAAKPAVPPKKDK
jgi:ATP-binding cassette, subfamily C, type I secretion system permease/ATPase